MLRRLTFSLWYYFHPPWDSGISPPELMDFIAHHHPRRAIDLGCGTGTNVLTLAQHGWQVTGIDFAPRAIWMARRKLRKAGVDAKLSVGDVTHLRGITGPFDLALDLGCFHGLPDRPAYLTQLLLVLAPGGFWLLYGRAKTDSSSPEPGITTADVDSIKAAGLEMLNRKDSLDKRGRPASWFLFQRPPA